MVMADRPEVATASGPVSALAVVGLAESMLNGLARVPFQKPWSGPGGLLDNLGQSVTRQTIRAFMGYSMGLPIEEFRSMEKFIDDICKIVLPPVVGLAGKVEIVADEVAGIPGIWCRAKDSTDSYVDDAEQKKAIDGTMLYLHGGGYIGTSPMMYAAFAAALVRLTGFEIFIADYRMAPEFPFPAGVHDAADVYRGLLERGVDPAHLVVAGDSGGGGLATSLVAYLRDHDLPKPAALALFSPEIDLDLDHDSIVENAPYDILPWSIPVAPYLRGVQPNDDRVSAVYGHPDPEWFPATFVCWGEVEMFRDGIRQFVENLEAAGVPVTGREERGMFHVFPILMPWAESSKRVLRELGELADRYVISDPQAAQTH
ncbi:MULTISPECIES: alpha/beta hydrolase [unclassified Gordonia (in: high G+C Gram-positive bacteria)]|uniref:alpha/beta hydrolase n=1 Tax=unclassified Gordonia (in: high G+C Gram-positive bacteria) TaxID=2657482 RepID=UPI0009AE33E4|nr:MULTISPECIES: alpha/beta hydrolase [unclassified Gordonia (in: high G+C Gram-positive bacteria)]MDF3282533.1 alpha/beta hydrolase [Gordonia sp. N1V]OPX09449.1 alpha/beta hydrolase [Gordonia sp. i37]